MGKKDDAKKLLQRLQEEATDDYLIQEMGRAVKDGNEEELGELVDRAKKRL